jgi:hypothetical protein
MPLRYRRNQPRRILARSFFDDIVEDIRGDVPAKLLLEF